MITSAAYEQRRLKLLAGYAQGATVLDLGYAQIPNPYLTEFHRVGYDLSTPAATGTRYEEEIVGDVRDISRALDGRRFDTIICGELIEHLENPYALLRDLRGLLADDGLLLVSTPNPFGIPNVLMEVTGNRRFFYTTEHLYCFAPRWVIRLLEHTGYRYMEKKGVGIRLPRLVIPLAPVNLSYQVIYVARKDAGN